MLVGVDEPELAEQAIPDIKSGTKLTARLEERVRRDVEERLRRLDFWEARVVGVDRQRDDDATILEVRVDPGPRYELELVAPPGAEKVARGAFPDPVEEDIHPAQTEVLADRIRENLQSEGYLLASVTAELDAHGPTHVLRVQADPGTIRKIATVDFPGALSIGADTLRSAAQVDRGRTQGLWGSPVSDATLDNDRRAVEEVYRREGYVEATVATPVLEAAGPDEVRVLFPVDEGRALGARPTSPSRACRWRRLRGSRTRRSLCSRPPRGTRARSRKPSASSPPRSPTAATPRDG